MIKRILWRIAFAGESGSVMMEYVILTVGIAVPFCAISLFLYAPDGQGALDSFGFLGDSYVLFVRRIMSAISLPIP